MRAMKKKIVLLVVLTMGLAGYTCGQTYEEYLRQENEAFRKFREQEKEAMARLEKEYTEYVNQRDREYTAYLKQEWERFRVFAGMQPPEKPKPTTLPQYRPQDEPAINRLPVMEIRTAVKPALNNLTTLPLIERPYEDGVEVQPMSFDFFGNKVRLDADPRWATLNLRDKGKAAIIRYWEEASEIAYTGLVNTLKEAREQFRVNDYGYYELVTKASAEIYPMQEQESERLLFTWVILVRSGYDVRMAYNNEQMALLVPSWNTLYGKRFLTIGNLNYYLFTPFEGEEILTCGKAWDMANRPLDFSISGAMNLGRETASREITFEFRDSIYRFNVAYDKSAVTFYRDYPQTDPEVYFNAPVSMAAKESLASQLLPVIRDLKETEAVNLLLALVQRGFVYKTDPEQFGREKFLFAEELFYYPAADCEDRSVLFSYLVRNLLSLKMVGLESPDHMFTAINFNDEEAFGDYVTYRGETFIVADPTYINAPYGRTMPAIMLDKARIIPVNNPGYDALTEGTATEIANRAGIKRAGPMPGVLVDGTGGFFVTGYFYASLTIGSFSATGYVDAQSYIVARMDDKGRLQWADHIRGTASATGLTINRDDAGYLYVAGSFSGSLGELRGGENPDFFVAKYTPGGERLWIRKAGFDTIPAGMGLIASVAFDPSGERRFARVNGYSETYNGYGLYPGDKLVIFNGFMPNSLVPATASLAVNMVTELDYAELLKKEYDQFVSNKTDRAVAGLLAMSNIIRKPGMALSGKEVQRAFDKYNPTFKTTYGNIYKLIGKVNFIRNANNIITVQTENGSDVLFDKLKLTNNSQMRVTILPDGNAQVDAITGVKVGKMVIWYPLNWVRVFSQTGDLLFDYDTDHAQVKLNLRKDILD